MRALSCASQSNPASLAQLGARLPEKLSGVSSVSCSVSMGRKGGEEPLEWTICPGTEARRDGGAADAKGPDGGKSGCKTNVLQGRGWASPLLTGCGWMGPVRCFFSFPK